MKRSIAGLSPEAARREIDRIEHLKRRDLATWEEEDRLFRLKRRLANDEFGRRMRENRGLGYMQGRGAS